jgi:glutamate/tyrosine decarboxylase-like PLP-dependent enzyme
VDGVELADSWACDGHKWLNVPYDSGYAFCAHPDAHATAMAYTAAYLTGQEEGRTFGGGDLVLESSRRARGFATWAALRASGRTGVADLVDRYCALARRFADGLAALDGVDVMNDVVLNQVLVRVGVRIASRAPSSRRACCGSERRRGVVSASCGSPCRTGRRAAKTSMPASTRSRERGSV